MLAELGSWILETIADTQAGWEKAESKPQVLTGPPLHPFMSSFQNCPGDMLLVLSSQSPRWAVITEATGGGHLCLCEQMPASLSFLCVPSPPLLLLLSTPPCLVSGFLPLAWAVALLVAFLRTFHPDLGYILCLPLLWNLYEPSQPW